MVAVPTCPNPYNTKGMAKACYEVLTNRDFANRLIQKGSKRTKLFTWEKHTNIVTKVYEEIIEEIDGRN